MNHYRDRRGSAVAPGLRAVLALAVWLLGSAAANAEIVQGQLELRWGDPVPAAASERKPARLQATLVTDGGLRIALDAGQARRAAGDLYALSNRRVAVEFAASGRIMSQQRAIAAIVPADRLWQSAPAIDASGRVMAAATVSGTTRWVTLMCRFGDIATEQKALSFFQAQYGNAAGQLGHYWSEVSYGRIDLTGSTAHGWYALPQPRSFYVTEENGEDKADLNKLFEDCSAAADPLVDFAGVQGINMMFNGDLDGYAWGGGSCAMLDGARRCLRVTWNPPWSFNNLAPLAHEMGHGYGLPHSDNSDGDDDTYDNPWDVMSDGWSNAVRDATYGSRPKHINVQQRDRLGWMAEARKLIIAAGNATTRQVMLDYASLAGSANTQMLILAMAAQPDPYRTVVYTVEARRRSGDYEAALAGDAVIIHRVDDNGTAYSVDADVPAADVSSNEGSMFKVGEIWHTPDQAHWLRVDGATATGFVLTVGPKPRVMSSPLPALRTPAPISAAQPALPSQQPPSARRARAVDSPGCVAGKLRRERPGACEVR
ncbi:hypothetical protein [Pseudoxanthomonas wuyuanensis]